METKEMTAKGLYRDFELGRINGKKVKVGRRTFILIQNEMNEKVLIDKFGGKYPSYSPLKPELPCFENDIGGKHFYGYDFVSKHQNELNNLLK